MVGCVCVRCETDERTKHLRSASALSSPGSTGWFMMRVFTTSAGVPSAAATRPAAREEQACVTASSRKPQSPRRRRWLVGVTSGGWG